MRSHNNKPSLTTSLIAAASALALYTGGTALLDHMLRDARTQMGECLLELDEQITNEDVENCEKKLD